MPETAEKRMSLAEFLEWDDGTDTRYELVGGQPVAMAPPSEAHGGDRDEPRGDQIRQPPESRHAMSSAEAGASCSARSRRHLLSGRPRRQLQRSYRARDAQHVPDPVLIVEVLSPSTAQHDRAPSCSTTVRSFRYGRSCSSASEARRVEIWRREGARWIVETLIGDAELRLAAVDEPIPLSAIYDNVAA